MAAGEFRPTIRKRVLGTNLRRLREERGLGLDDAAEQLSCHIAKVSRIESGKSGIRQLDLKVLLDLYGVTDPEERAGWLALAKESRRKTWFRDLADQFPPAVLDLIELEKEVSECRSFQPSVIPGLLQTQDYAAAVIRGGQPGDLDEDQKTKIRARMERQKALTREDQPPLNVWMVVGEAALRQEIGGPQVLREQLLHLAQVAQLPNVTVQVLPFTAGACMGGMLSFLIYTFPAPAKLEVVLLESFMNVAYLESAEDTARYSSNFDHIRASALSALKSEAVIMRAVKDLARK